VGNDTSLPRTLGKWKISMKFIIISWKPYISVSAYGIHQGYVMSLRIFLNRTDRLTRPAYSLLVAPALLEAMSIPTTFLAVGTITTTMTDGATRIHSTRLSCRLSKGIRQGKKVVMFPPSRKLWDMLCRVRIMMRSCKSHTITESIEMNRC
jgi:hypothetical protein